jgi:hypothetical protein
VLKYMCRYRSRGVVIHKDKLCALCGKRIGEATAFSYYPNGTVVHFKVRTICTPAVG